MDRIDILLPTYNGEKYIGEQIESLLNQTYLNIKIIIRDDYSSDNTLEILKKYELMDSRIKIIKDNYKNIGLVKNIELLLESSNAKYIMYCDQDDYWFSNKVEKLYSVINKENQKNSILVHSDSYITNEKLKIKGRFRGNKPLETGLINSCFNYYVQGATIIFNQSLKEKILPFNSKVYLHDRYTHLVCELEGKRIYLNEPLMYYRQHETNIVGSKNIIIKIKNNINFLSKNFFLKEDAELIKILYENKNYKEKLEVYMNFLNKKYTIIEKIKIIKKEKIKLRLKEKFLILLNK